MSEYLKKVSNRQDDISDKHLSHKTVMLIALTSALRSSGIHLLDTALMEISDSSITFTFNQLTKTWRKGQ